MGSREAGVVAFLQRHRRIGIDSSALIYQFEGHPVYELLTDPVFRLLQFGGLRAVASCVVLTEVLVPAWRWSSVDVRDEIHARLVNYPNVEWIPAGGQVCDVAAMFRARYNLRTPDAIHAATATVSDATGFVTNDRVFTRIPSFETLVLEDLV